MEVPEPEIPTAEVLATDAAKIPDGAEVPHQPEV
jgi:hypothetical protein